ncbi:MAG: type II 3-dehydroquinate dehydratase [Vampirovibrionales bacterium]|nr:type II 3-dehydroquinate dehydratase [Vampirovibrionales bacterium]
MKVLVINGPNLGALGRREPELYGQKTLSDIETDLQGLIEQWPDWQLTCVQSNHEGELIDTLLASTHEALIINAGGLTHTSVALRDAISIFKRAGASVKVKPVIEVHLSNIYAREAFRHNSYISPVATGTICGLGAHGYTLALHALKQLNRA